MRILIQLIIFSSLISCGLIPSRDHWNQMEEQHEPMFRPRENFKVVSGDTGDTMDSIDDYMHRVPAADYSLKARAQKMSLSEELRDLEDRQSEADYNLYLENEAILGSVSEKIYFLKMNSSIERQKYLENKGYRSRTRLTKVDDIPFESLNPGMSKAEILKRFGRPMSKDIAGNPENENERWSYHNGDEVRYIYFEQGRVDGWSNNQY